MRNDIDSPLIHFATANAFYNALSKTKSAFSLFAKKFKTEAS